MTTSLNTVGDLFGRMQSALSDFQSGAKTSGSVDAKLAESLNSTLSAVAGELNDDDSSEEKTKLLSTISAPEEFQSLTELSSFVGTALDALSSLSSSVSSFSGATSSLASLQSSISTAMAPPPPPPEPEPVIEYNLFAQPETTTATSTTIVPTNNLFAEPASTTTSTAEPLVTATAAAQTETSTSTTATSTTTGSSAATGPSPNGNAYGLHKDVRDQLVRYKQDKGADLDSETNAALQAAIDELEPLTQGATGNGSQVAIGNLSDLETFVGNAANQIAASSLDPVLNPAGFAPPGLNKLKDHLHGKNNPVPAPASTVTASSSGTTTGSTTTSSTSGTSSSGAININIGGTGSTSGTESTGGSGSTGGTASTGGTGTGGTGSTGGTGTGGTGSGGFQAGTAQTVADFGSVTIDGHTTYLGSVQAPYMTTAQASQYVAGAINADQKSTVTAGINDQGQLQLTSKTGGNISVDRVGITSTGDTSQLVDTGLQTGSYGSSVTAGSPTSPYFADTFDQVYSAISSGSLTAPAMSSTMFSAAKTTTTSTFTGSTSTGGTATASIGTTTPTFTAAAPTTTTSASAPVTNPIAGQTNISNPISTQSLTDFGKLTINGKQFNLGSLQTINQTKESAANYLANVFNVQGSGMLSAQAVGSQLILNSNDGSALNVQSLSASLDLTDPQNRFGFAGFAPGQLGAGSLTGGEIIM